MEIRNSSNKKLNNYFILITGLPGSGKTTLSKILEKKLKIPRITSEFVGNILYPDIKFNKKDYDFNPQQISTIYKVIDMVAKYFSLIKHSLIIDGVFRFRKDREKIENIALQHKTIFYGIHLLCSEKIVLQRLKKRNLEDSISPCGIETYKKICKEYEKVNDTYYVFDTSEIKPMKLADKIVKLIKIEG